MSWPYSTTVKDHFFNPRNVLREGEKFTADGVGEVGSPACGDVMKVFIKVDRKKDRITDLRWQTFGCASAIGSMSMLSVMATERGGMKIERALKITPAQILKRLHGLPQNKIHCSVLGDKALRSAVYNYFEKSGQNERIPGREKNDNKDKQIICTCLGVTKRELELLVRSGSRTFAEVQQRSKIGTGCGQCVPKVKKMIVALNKKYPPTRSNSNCESCTKRCCQK